MVNKSLITVLAVLLTLPAAVLAQVEGTLPALTVDAQLCIGVSDRMPVGAADSFMPDVDSVFLWCRVTGAQDTTTIKHVWYYRSEEMTSIELPVNASSWRTWSSKTILPTWTGRWEVKILNAAGSELAVVPFTIGPGE